MPLYFKTERGYFYKQYKNGKKRRVSQKEYHLKNMIGGVNERVLIYCHPKPVSLTNENSHWQIPIFKKILEDRGIDINHVKIDTIDVENGGTIKNNGFSNRFINSHKNEFDIVILPDCAGEWFNFKNDVYKLIELMLNLLEIVKTGGIIMFGKWIYPNIREQIFGMLLEFGYNVELVKFDLFGPQDVDYIKITKM